MGEENLEVADEAQVKKPKLDVAPPATCAHFLKRKKRLCKMTVAKGNKYCGEHIPQEAIQAELETSESDKTLARIPCPLDPKHTVYKKNLRKHLKICNARPIENQPAYIEKGINNGGDLEIDSEDFSNLKLSDLGPEELQSIIDKVKQIYKEHVEGQIKTLTVKHNCLDEELSNAEYGKETRKHLLQTSALLGILQEEARLQELTSFIEFGAGKGQLAFYLANLIKGLNNSKVILLDRMSLRHKKDNKIEDRSLVERIRVDIADFKIDELEILRNTKRIVAFSKHLCGAATDLTLRCITQPKVADAAKVMPSTEFVMIALCCHHRCEWRSFVGKEFFESQNLTRRDFIIMTKMVSWAICGSGMSRERRALEAAKSTGLGGEQKSTVTNNNNLTIAEKENIGFICKRILDIARLKYLQNHNFQVSLAAYVSSDVTLENVCLLAKKQNVPS